jgi:DpnD/PcfM-like protein
METFKIEVQEFLSRVVEVEAKSINEAISKINAQYEKTEIVLDYNDFVEVNFCDINSQSPIDEKDKLIKGVIEYLFEDEKKHFEEFDAAPENHIYLKIKRLNELLNG